VPVDLEEMLTEMLAKVSGSRQRDDLEARFKALEERKTDLKLADVLSALEHASDEELAALESSALGDLVRQARAAEALDTTAPADDDAGAAGRGTAKPKRRTRPGRKAGQAYGWWVGADGQVEKLDIARVYTGEDEADEVDLPPVEIETPPEEEAVA
jgi:hypothetical protein